MEGLEVAPLREQALIWATALLLAFAGFRAAERAVPGPFADARAQLTVESRNLRWLAADLKAGGTSVLTGPGGLSLAGLRGSLEAENERLAARVGGHAAVQRADLLERANQGLR